jgi:AcrR family transcriptional regulator
MREDVESPLVRKLIDRTFEDRRSAADRDVDRLIEATFQVIAESGRIDPPVRDILRVAGLSTPTFYRHFQSKDELLLVTWDRGVRILTGYLQGRMARVVDPLGRIRAWIEGVMRQGTVDQRASDRARPFTMEGASLGRKFPAEHHQTIELLVAPLHEAIEWGVSEGKCVSADPRRDARIIYDYVFANLFSVLIYNEIADAQTIEHLVDFAFRALEVNSDRATE